MGRILVVGRLAVRDLRRRRIEAALLLLAIMAATTTLTLGLVLRDAASDPYQNTREATNGPDVVGSASRPAQLSGLEELASAPGVLDHSGPYPVTPAELQASGRTSDVQAVGRDAAAASVDQPEPIQGTWVSDGGVVVEAAFAKALGVRVGDPVTLDGRSFEVVGVAVTAAIPPYPGASCMVAVGCASGATPQELSQLPPGLLRNPGLVWLTEADVRSLATNSGSVSYVMNLKLADPDSAQAFVDASLPRGLDAPRLESWESILQGPPNWPETPRSF
jgi:putative ABC transport system permease protein